MNNKLYIFSLATLVFAFIVLGYFTFLLFQPFKEPIIYTHPFEVVNENKEVKRGEKLYYQVDFEKRQDVSVTSYNNIVCQDGNLVTLVPQSTIVQNTRAPVGRQLVTDFKIIPEKTSLGECKIEIEVVYHVNRLKDVHRHRETEWFTVYE